jgi:centromere protein C
MHALPTPYKEVKREVKEKKTKKRKKGDDDDSDDDTTRKSVKESSPFDDKPLRKKVRIKNGESGSAWSETLESSTDMKIVSRLDNRSFSKLPLSTTRKKRESKVVGFASQAFHVSTDDDDLFPGYIAGNVVLPPRGIKDAEGVGLCSQVFNVGDCQPNSLEFALADPTGQDGEFDPKSAQRYLLSKGDMFQIPPGNVYRIENHSKTEKANLFWTIIKCTSRAEQEDDDSDED